MILRSDDFKYAVSGDESRVGFYLDPQLPWLGIDIDAKYFSGAANKEYKWDSNTSGISSGTGKMLKYTVTYKNLSQELLNTSTYNRKMQRQTSCLILRFLWHCRIWNRSLRTHSSMCSIRTTPTVALTAISSAIITPALRKEQRQSSGNACEESGRCDTAVDMAY